MLASCQCFDIENWTQFISYVGQMSMFWRRKLNTYVGQISMSWRKGLNTYWSDDDVLTEGAWNRRMPEEEETYQEGTRMQIPQQGCEDPCQRERKSRWQQTCSWWQENSEVHTEVGEQGWTWWPEDNPNCVVLGVSDFWGRRHLGQPAGITLQ